MQNQLFTAVSWVRTHAPRQDCLRETCSRNSALLDGVVTRGTPFALFELVLRLTGISRL